MKKTSSIAVIVLLCMLLSTSVALAAEIRGGDTVTIGRDEVIDDDLYVGGGSISIMGKINGDLIVFGGQVDVSGDINGDAIVAGGRVMIDGKVSDDIRVAGGQLYLGGDVGDDVIGGGGTIEVRGGSTIGGDLMVGGGQLTLAGTVLGKVQVGAGSLIISGAIKKDVDAQVDDLTITPSGKIEGNLTYTSENKAKIEQGAQVLGKTTHNMPEVEKAKEVPFWSQVGGTIIGKIRWLVAPILLGLVLIFMFPRATRAVGDAIVESPWKSLGLGVLSLIVVPIVILILFVLTLILGGFPITLVLMALFGIALIICNIFVGLVIGELFLWLFKREGRIAPIWSLIVGLVILAILGIIPYLGGAVGLLTLLFGLGALVLAQIRGYSRARAEGRI